MHTKIEAANPAAKSSRSAVRRTILRGGTAMISVLAATNAYAQCAPVPNSPVVGNLPEFGLPSSSTASGISSLISVLTTQNTAFLTQTSGFIGAPASPAPGLQGGGAWVRGIGGTFDTNVSATFTRDASPTTPVPATVGCNVRTFQDYSGFQTGADIARLNVDGFNIHGGVTVGYTESQIRSNGSFRGQFQTPFVGLYGAITKGSFFADGQVRWDFYQGLLSDPNNTLFNQRLDARSLSLTGNVGYQFPLADNWFVEPSAGAVYSEVKVDRLQTGGAIFLFNNPSFAGPTSIKIRDFDSILGRASLRIGRNFIVDGYALQPFITASVINEFGGNVRTSLLTGLDSVLSTQGSAPGTFSALEQAGTIVSRRIGVYGQFSGGVAGQILNTGWLGYVRGDYRTGDRVDGWGISGGLRYQFNPELAARPLITKGDAPAPVITALDAPVNWTGFHVGVSSGGLWSRTRQTEAAFFIDDIQTVNPHAAGVYGGGQIGLDYQIGNIVVGIGGDAGFTNARGGRGCGGSAGGFVYTCETNIDDLYTATGRIGYATERSLFYAKGGAAFADTSERQKSNFNGQPLFILSTGQFPNSTVRDFATGWTVGAGFEFAITRNITAKAEYMHFELDGRNYLFPTQANQAYLSARHTGDIVKVGVNYRFNFDPPAPPPAPRPVIAKY